MKRSLIAALLLTASLSSFASEVLILQGEPSDAKFKECSLEISKNGENTKYRVRFVIRPGQFSYGDINQEMHLTNVAKYDVNEYTSKEIKSKVKGNEIKNVVTIRSGWYEGEKIEAMLKLAKLDDQISDLDYTEKHTTNYIARQIQMQCPSDVSHFECDVRNTVDISKAVLQIPSKTVMESKASCLNLR